MAEVKVGDTASNFTLKDQDGEEITLSTYKGKRVLLSFHPLAWTAICAKQMQSLEASFDTFESNNTVALGMSVDTVPCKKAWAKNLGIEKTRLLSDFWPHGDVAKLYGIFREEHGFSARANIILDEDQKVVFVKIYELKTLPDINKIIGFIEDM